MNCSVDRTRAAAPYSCQDEALILRPTSNDKDLISAHTDSSMVESTSDVY